MSLYQIKSIRAALLAVMLCSTGILYAQDTQDESSDARVLDELSLGELLDLQVSIASKVKEDISDAPGVISVVTKDELQRFGGTTLADVLKRVPSFLGATIYMTDRSVIASRGDQVGSSSSHILLLVNGRPMREIHEAGIKSEVLESFPVSVIERIEVIRGPGSVLYGTQAFSAVINVVTKSPENNTVSLSGRLGEGLNNDIMADLQYKIGDFGIVLAGRYADKGGWETQWNASGDPPPPLAQFAVENNKIYTIDLTIPDYGPGVYGELSWKGFRFMSSYNQWSTQYYVPPYQWLHNIPPDLPPPLPQYIDENTTNRAEWKKYFADLGYKHDFTEWYSANLNVTYTKSQFENRGWPNTSRDAYEAIVELTNFFTPVENFNILIGGVGGIITGLEQNAKEIPDWNGGIYNKGHMGFTFSGYAQADYRWEWCKIIGGLQVNKVRFKDSLDHVDNFKADFNPRAGLIFYPLEHINIKSLFSTAYRAPSLNELYMDYSVIAGKMTRRDDPLFATWDHKYTMEPEKVYTYDLGVNYQDDNVQFGINGFYSNMKNIVATIVDPTRYSDPTWDNYSEVSIFGLECEGKYYLTKSLLFEGSFLYQQNRDEKTEETDVTPIPNFSAKGGLSYQADFGLTISAFNTFRQSVHPKYYDKLNTSTGHYNMAHVHCSYDLNKLFKFSAAKELSLVLDVDNLLDEEVWLPSWGEGPGFMIPCNEGRTIYGGFKVAF